MKSFPIFLVLLFVIQTTASSQNLIFEKGTIVTKKNDTLQVLVELSVSYLDVVYIKTDVNASERILKINKISSLETPYNTFENISVGKREYLFRSLINGRYSLLQYVEVNSGSSYPSQGGEMTLYIPPTTIYALKTDSALYILKKKKDKEQLVSLAENCPPAKAMIEPQSFNLEDLVEFVKELNKCK
jgi:hypothetical protein